MRIVVRDQRLRTVRFTVKLDGHAPVAVFQMPAWAVERQITLPLRCRAGSNITDPDSGTTFLVRGAFDVSSPNRGPGRSLIRWVEPPAFDSEGISEIATGYDLLRKDWKTTAPVTLFQYDLAKQRLRRTPGLSLVQDTPTDLSVRHEFTQGPKVVSEATMHLDAAGRARFLLFWEQSRKSRARLRARARLRGQIRLHSLI